MILVAPKMSRKGIPESILDNKVLIYFVTVEDERVIAESKLISIREMMQDLREDVPESVPELVRRHRDWENGHVDLGDRTVEEAVFDQESAEIRAEALCNATGTAGSDDIFAQLGMHLIDAFSDHLPESVDYAV